MRIDHVTDCYLPRLGGIELHVHDLVVRQRARGHDARVLTATPGDPSAPEPDPAWVHRRPHLHDPDGPGPADVAHVHASVWSPYAMTSVRRLVADRVPTVVTVHSLWGRYGPAPAVVGGLLGVRRWPVVWSAVSERAAEQVRDGLGVPVRVLPNAVDPDLWAPDPTGRPGPTGGEPLTLLTVGRLSWTKRVLALPGILARVRERLPADQPLRSVIVGDGPQRPALERAVAGLPWVEVRGRVDRSEIRRLLAEADVYVAPAALESFGIAALEARAAGLPVVAHAASGVGQFVRHGRDGFLVDDDAGFVSALTVLLRDPAVRAAIGEHNRVVRPTCDWTRACDGAESLYDLAAGLTRPARQPVRVGLAARG